MTPRLVYSELTRRVYVLTRYRCKTVPDDLGLKTILIASQKYDVTEDFAALRSKRLRGVGRRADGRGKPGLLKAKRPS